MTEETTLLYGDETVQLVDAFSRIKNTPCSIRGFSEKDMEAFFPIGLSYYHKGNCEKEQDIFTFLSFYDPLNSHSKLTHPKGGHHG